MSNDLVIRLRFYAGQTVATLHRWIYAEVADFIEAQDARIAELEAALRFYDDAENWRRNGQLDPDSGNFTGGPARAALTGGKDE